LLYAALKRRSFTVVSAFGTTERRALPGCAGPVDRVTGSKIKIKGSGQECPLHTGNVNFKGVRCGLRSVPPLRQAQGRLLLTERARMGTLGLLYAALKRHSFTVVPALRYA
jgi:hypothetical protein